MGNMKDTEQYLKAFQEAYVQCLLWTDEDMAREDTEERGDEWDENLWTSEKVRSGDWGVMRSELTDFILANHGDLREYRDKGRGAADAGHDFALSRNGHGTGFWDRGMGELGDRLHKAAKVYGEESLILCEDGSIAVV